MIGRRSLPSFLQPQRRNSFRSMLALIFLATVLSAFVILLVYQVARSEAGEDPDSARVDAPRVPEGE